MGSSSKRLQIGIRGLLLLVFVVAVGLILTGYANSRLQAKYESRCRFQITPNWLLSDEVSEELAGRVAAICQLPHDEYMLNRKFIEDCFKKNNLFVLNSFIGLFQDECIDLIEQNLLVTKLTERGCVYEIQLALENPTDAATVVNNLVKCHFDNVQSEFDDLVVQGNPFGFWNVQIARVGRIPEFDNSKLSVGLVISSLLAALILFPCNPIDPRTKQLSLLGIIALFAIIFGCFTIGYGVAWFIGQTPVFENEATVEITDNCQLDPTQDAESLQNRLAKAAQRPHEFLIKQYNPVELALERNNLFVLDMFVDLAKEESVELVQKNLDVVWDRANPSEYKLKFVAEDPTECANVLDKVIESYFYQLKRENRASIQDAARFEESGFDDPTLEFGKPIQFKTRFVEPVSEPKSYRVSGSSQSSRMFGGWLVAMVGFVAVTFWSNSRKRKHLQEPDRSESIQD